MLTAERTCNLCDGTLEYMDPLWVAWLRVKALYLRKGMTAEVKATLDRTRPVCPLMMPCPLCHEGM